jgi:hypothetical protein
LGCGPAEYADIPPKSLCGIEVFGSLAVRALVLLLAFGGVRVLGSNGTHDDVTLFVVPDELHLYTLAGGKYLARLELLLAG